MKKDLYIINGPNLARVGTREPDIYGKVSLPDFLSSLRTEYFQKGINIEISFSSHEGDIIDLLYQAQDNRAIGIVLNAGAYTHTSIAIADAIRAIQKPVIEVHLSNIFAREAFRHHSFLAPYCLGSISGLGVNGYRWAIEELIHRSLPQE